MSERQEEATTELWQSETKAKQKLSERKEGRVEISEWGEEGTVEISKREENRV